MKQEQIKRIAIEYEHQSDLEAKYRETLEREIDAINEKIYRSIDKPIYKLLYKPEYGDYREYVDSISAELRNRQKINNL